MDDKDKALLNNEWRLYSFYLQAFLNARLLYEFYDTEGCVLWVEKITISVEY